MRISLLLLTLPLVVGCQFPRFHATRTVKQTLETSPLTAVDLSTFNGAIEVQVHDQPSVDMTVDYKAYGESEGDAQEKCEQLDCEITAEEGILKLKATKPSGLWMASAKFKLMVPSDIDLVLQTSNGTVDVADVAGIVDVNTSNGTVNLTRVGGDMKVRTSNGRVNAKDCTGTFDVNTSNGRVSFAGVMVGDANRISTSNGKVTLELASEIPMELESKTSNGSVNCGLNVIDTISKGKRSFHGIIGNGGINGDLAKLYVKSSNGSINISAWQPEIEPMEETSTLGTGEVAEVAYESEINVGD